MSIIYYFEKKEKAMKIITPTSTNKFLKLIALFSFLIIGYTASAQEQKEVKEQTYTIIDNGSVRDVQPYIDAMNNSDFKYHRLLNKRYIIVFEKGVKVELFSATEISKNGIQINLSDYPESFDPTRQEPIYALGANNFILEYYTALGKH